MAISSQASTASLLLAALLTYTAAMAHFACIGLGTPAFRFLGAGEPIAQMAARGHWYPPFIAFVIGAVLALGATYALAGAGVIPALPFTRYAIPAIAAVFLLRALLFPVLKPVFPGNSEAFWWTTSLICLFIGLAYLIGAWGLWQRG